MTAWNLADVWEAVADALPDAQALVHGKERLTWAEVDRRADGIAACLLGIATERQQKVAHYLYNCNEYLESLFAIVKAGLVPVNTNYRYGDDEILYLWDNADVIAVVFHGIFAERIERLRSRLPGVRAWLWVDDGEGDCPDWAVPYETAALAATARTVPPWARSPDDLYLLYTGGTTGMPKGVMWRQDDIFANLNASNFVRWPEDGNLDDLHKGLAVPGAVHVPACPLMHGTGAFTSFAAWLAGGSVATLTGRSFRADELLDTVQEQRVNTIAIVGDAFAKPILSALDADTGRWDLSSLFAIISSGVMWSEPVKQGMLRHHPNMLLVDAFSSSEALGMGTSVSSAAGAQATATFALGERARVIAEDGADIVPGTGQAGRLALKGRNPIGYYKDPEKSAATFPVIDGVRYSVPGDWATVDADGTIHLLGRGSVCINTGGEKVFPEEVEEIMKLHPSVLDAVAVGIPDDRFGETVGAVVELRDGNVLDPAELTAFVRERLAAYKAPRTVHVVPTIGRSPAGKVDYARLKEEAITAAAVAG